MKKILLTCMALSLALAACTREEGVPSDGAEGMKRFTFAVNIPDSRALTRAAWVAGDDNLLIGDMWVLVFDEGGGFLSRHKAQPNETVTSFMVDLPKSDKARTLHFVCNYDGWESFDDIDALHRNEATVLANLTVEYPRIAYWTRVELPDGIMTGSEISVVTLIRNVAKISVVNNSLAHLNTDPLAEDYVSSYLSDMEYAIGNYNDLGTVALFNRETGEFNTVTGTAIPLFEAPGAEKVAIDQSADFLPAYLANISDTDGRSLYTYEQVKSAPGSTDRLFIILRANFVDEYTTVQNPRYYKIDIVHPNAEELLDVHRNRHYILTVGKVVWNGYGSFQEAVDGLSLNNAVTSMEQEYNSVSDGKALFNVDYTNGLFTKAGQEVSMRYSYIPDAYSGATDNRNVQAVVTHGTYPAMGFHEGSVTTDENGVIRMVPGSVALPNKKIPLLLPNGQTNPDGTDYLYTSDGNSDKIIQPNSSIGIDYGKAFTATLPPEGFYGQTSVRISKGGLSRTIIIRLKQPYQFGVVDVNRPELGGLQGTTPETPWKIYAAPEIGVPVEVPLNLYTYVGNDDIESRLPIDVYVDFPDSNGSRLMPDGANSGLHVIDLGTIYRLQFTVRTVGEGRNVLRFVTTTRTGGGVIKVSSELFEDAYFQIVRDESELD